MVVVSGNWIKNVPPWPPSLNRDLAVETNKNMAAKAILICRPNSDRFEDRTLTLDQQIKVGRAVARAKPTESNAIFDCKVLSRHHALLWYEDGKFYLQDTKSSNGTFVNNNRLSADRHEISSGDIVQFGVDVIENNRKVTHGCIIATLKLYLPDGKEAKASPSITEADSHSKSVLIIIQGLPEITLQLLTTNFLPKNKAIYLCKLTYIKSCFILLLQGAKVFFEIISKGIYQFS